ncbi:SH3 domain-containing protein [Thalassococcus sp. CAU 1522]|uniref:SH3 domain-containing protein n=1 Tax=Thalassococcus arenae TaxID=2851652 RepID=A0ABS6NCM8_9RHOB|nr:SH3 domain-containing protein [Thalassococcus arenae]MBV2361305.1 SH3 domain-containing protein [Thalassococcus arenae]
MLRLLALLAALVIATSAPAATHLFVDAPRDGALNLRAGPSTGYSVLEAMPHGSRVRVLSAPGTWLKVESASGRVGWAHGGYLSAQPVLIEVRDPVPAPDPVQERRWVDAPDGALNLRGGPDTQYAVQSILRNGDAVTVLGDIGSWSLVQPETGPLGWSATRYLVDRAPRPDPVIAPPTAVPGPVVPMIARIVNRCRDAYERDLRRCIRRELGMDAGS